MKPSADQSLEKARSAPPSKAPGTGDSLLFALHAAIDSTALWEATRDLLRREFPCVRVTLFLGHIGMGEARVVYTDPSIEASAQWFEQRGKLNPFSPWIEDNIGEPYYRFSDIVGPPEEFRKTEFYQRFAREEGWNKGISGIFWNKREVRAMFSIYRSPEQPDFDDLEIDRLLGWMRHIEIATIRVQKVNREQHFRGAFESFNRNMPVPLLLLDWERTVVFVNRAAYESAAVWNYGQEKARSFNARECFMVPPAILRAVDDFKDQISALEPKTLARRLPEPVTVPWATDPRHRAQINPTRFGEGSLARPGFFVLFLGPDFDETPDDATNRRARRLRDLQTLTPAEREIVKAVCRGLRNAEIAKELNKSVLTVKTQLNSVFQKLDVRSRGQLIARMK